MKVHRAAHAIATMCRMLDVSASGYYAWLTRARSARAQQDASLTTEIHRIHAPSRGTYGAPRMHAELVAAGTRVSRKRVARLMRAAGLRGVSRRTRIVTTVGAPGARPAPDLVQRQFTAAGPDQLWVADITYIRTWSGFLYLAVVLDAWSRRVVGWAMETHLRTALVLAALEMAVRQRQPGAVIHGRRPTPSTAARPPLAKGQRRVLRALVPVRDDREPVSTLNTGHTRALDRPALAAETLAGLTRVRLAW
jgi:putative transposase